jgi:flagellar biosynthesis protein FliQ
VSFGILDMDTQPYSLIFILLALVYRGKFLKLGMTINESLILIIIGFIISIFRTENLINFQSFRYIYGILLFVFSLIFFNDYISRKGLPLRIIKNANVVYLLVSVLELFTPFLVAGLTPTRTVLGRGLTSLTPEPSYFATFLFFCSFIYWISSNYKFKKDMYFHFANLIFIVLFAKSSIGLLLILISFLLYQISNIKISKLLIIILFSILLVSYLPQIIDFIVPSSRISNVVSQIFKIGINEIFYIDASFNQRLDHIVTSIHASLNNFLIPSGIDSFTVERNEILPYYDGYFWYAGETNIIMSWIGFMIFHLGLFFLLAFGLILFKIKDNPQDIIAFLIFIIILMTPIPAGFPITYLIFALFITKAKKVSILNKKLNTYKD